MKRRLLAPLLLALASTPALAWSDHGHEVIAKLTYDQLTPHSQRWVNSLLTGGDYSESFVSGSTWVKRASESPFFQRLFRYEQVLGKECLDKCLITRAYAAITTLQKADLKKSPDQQPSYLEQQQALMSLLYYVAEIHQPLNGGFKRDNHGKGIHGLNYQGTTDTLYGWWNTQFVKSIERNARPINMPGTPTTTPPLNRWLNESSDIAKRTAYGPRPRTNLSGEYVATARDTVKQRVTKASERLAQIINQLPATQIPPEEIVAHTIPQSSQASATTPIPQHP